VRRDPKTIVAAHRLDPDRKEVFVEGGTDRLFLSWVTSGTRNKNARIVEAAFVDLNVAFGGERGRLMKLAEYAAPTAARILVFADADTDRLRNAVTPANVVLTDGRDLEGYVLREECMEKVARLGLGTERIDIRRFLADVSAASRLCGALRYVSEIDGLNLPFQRVTIERYASAKHGVLEVDLPAFVQTLLQNAGISVREVDRIIRRAGEVLSQFGAISDLVHGKDALRLADVALKHEGVRSDEARRMLWCTFERGWVRAHPGLAKIVEFLETP
jgi:hypothetical protein